MHRYFSESVPWGATLTRRRLLEAVGLAGAGAASAAVLGPVLTASGASRADRWSLHDTMRKLWEDHVTWTRMVIVSFIAGSPDLDAGMRRLLANQDDIGAAIVPFFGQAAGERLSELLREHILGAAMILDAAKAGDGPATDAAVAAWYTNADDIAAFLSAANPRKWPLEHMRMMMHEHLDLTLEEATARLTGDWDADVAAYDKIHIAILNMADMLTAGLT